MSVFISAASDGSFVLLLQRLHFTARNLYQSFEALNEQLEDALHNSQFQRNVSRISFQFCSFDAIGALRFVQSVQASSLFRLYGLRLCCRHCTGISALLSTLGFQDNDLDSSKCDAATRPLELVAGSDLHAGKSPQTDFTSSSSAAAGGLHRRLASIEIHSAGTYFGFPHDCFFNMNNLTTLTLGGCPQLFNTTYLGQLSVALSVAKPPVRKLSLWACNIQLSAPAAVCLTRILRALPVEELDLSHNVALLTPHGGLQAFPWDCCDGLPLVLQGKAIRGLNLSGVKITNAHALARLLAPCQQSMERLFVVNCSLGPDNIQPIADAIQSMPNLQHLNAADNLLEAAGGAAIVSALWGKPSLCRVLLHRCGLTWEAAPSIATLLETCPQLQLLCLKQNYLHDTGANTIASSLMQAGALQSLSLAENRVARSGTASLALATAESRIRHVSLQGNEPTAWHSLAEVYDAVSSRAARGQTEAAGMHRFFAWAAASVKRSWNTRRHHALTTHLDEALAMTSGPEAVTGIEHRPRSVVANAFAPRSVALPPPPMLPSAPPSMPHTDLPQPTVPASQVLLGSTDAGPAATVRMQLTEHAGPGSPSLLPFAASGTTEAPSHSSSSLHNLVHRALSIDIVLSLVLSFWSPGQALHAYPLVFEMPCSPGKHEMLHVHQAVLNQSQHAAAATEAGERDGPGAPMANAAAAAQRIRTRARTGTGQTQQPSHAYLLQAMAACGGGRLSGVSSAPRRECRGVLKAFNGQVSIEEFIMRHGCMQELTASPSAQAALRTGPHLISQAAVASSGGAAAGRMSALEEHPAFPPQ